MNELFSQGGKGSTGILTNKQAIARKFGVKQNEVVYFAVGVDLGGYKVIYDKSTQRAYSLPVLPAGTTAVSLNEHAVLVHSAGTVDLGELAVTRREFVCLSDSFATGLVVNTRNELLFHNGIGYTYLGSLPVTISSGINPVGNSDWKPQMTPGLPSTEGASLVGDVLLGNVASALASRKVVFNSVANMLAKDFTNVPEGYLVTTLSNEHGVTVESDWVVSSTANTSTYNKELMGGKYANLVVKPVMGFAEFGYGSTNPADNPLAVDEACRVARANPVVHTLTFPSGSFQCSDTIRLDVDRRGFTFDGAGRDNSIIFSTAPDISLHHVGIDPRNSTRDRLHWHQTVKGFTVNGQVDSLGVAGARRSVSTAPYGTYAYKSINHRISNYDILHLVGYLDAFSGGASLGSTYTKYGIRIRNNSNKVTGYIGGASSGCTVSIEGGRTSLTVAANAGDTTITVADASAFDTLFELGFGSPLRETKRIASISGNVITLDKGLTNSYESGSVVEVPCVANTVTNATIETGEIRIGDSEDTVLIGNYSEEAKWVIRKYLRNLLITGNTAAESSPAMSITDEIDPRSSLTILDNSFTFPIGLSIKDRTGTVSDRIDLYNMPKLCIERSTRVQNPIFINGVYGFSSLNVTKTFSTEASEDRFTKFKFTGLSVVATSGSSSYEALKFHQDGTTKGFDGYTFHLDIMCRRVGNSSVVTPGILQRIGTSSSAPGSQNSAPVSLFSDFNSSTGFDVTIGASSNRGTISVKPSATVTVVATISGEVTHII